MGGHPERDGLRLWQRFHVRLTAMYGVLVLAVLLSVAGFFYVRGVDREMAALQSRILIAATSLATSITPQELEPIQKPGDEQLPQYKAIQARFRIVAAAEPEFSYLYIMRRGDAPDTVEAVVDLALIADAPPAEPGELYESPEHVPVMLEGFDHPIVEDEPAADEWGNVLSGYAPIRAPDGKAIAIVGVDVRATSIAAMKREVATLVLAVLALAVLALVILGTVVGRSVQRPLAQIVEATNAIASGQLHVRAKLERGDEFGVVGKHFDEMASGLEEREFIKATFGQYVAPEVVQKMLSERSEAVRGQRRHVAVMFTDLRKFTTLSEGMAPEDVVALLNSYLERMTRVITGHGGRIDKFIGDAIMSDWGTLEVPEGKTPETAAIDCALAMLRELAAWNVERARANYAPVSIGIAIHAGQVVAGSVGSAKKLEYTVIGDTVNVASRLEGMCKVFGSPLVVSGAVVDGADRRSTARWLDELVLRGRNVTTEVFEILDPEDPRYAHLSTYAEGVRQLRAGELVAARATFEKLLALGPDPVTEYQLQRTTSPTAELDD